MLSDSGGARGQDNGGSKTPPITIKKYANRRLYNTATSSYVTLDTLATMVKEGKDFVVYDAKTGEDITRSVLTQIIFEEEAKGENLLPVNFLRQLIGFYGNSMQSFVPSYLEMSLESLTKNQERFSRAFGGEAAVDAMRTMTQRNAELFEQTVKMFSPFGAASPLAQGLGGLFPGNAQDDPTKAPPEQPAPASEDITALQDQITQLQKAIDAMAKKG